MTTFEPDRRRVVQTLMSGAVAVVALPHLGLAAASLSVGRFQVTTISDGHLLLPEAFSAPDADQVARQALLGDLIDGGGMVQSPLNVTIVRDGEQTVLIDAGSGERFVPTAGRLLEGLDALGVAPEYVTKVVLTHAHPDHLWGVVDGFDEVTFYEAEHVINAAEMDFWLSGDVLTRVPEDQQSFAVGARRHLDAISDQLTRAKPGDDVISGVRLVDTSGHTPGHVSLEISDGDASAFVLGDALAHPVLSFARPDWQPRMDLMADRAVETRKRLLARLATDGTPVIGYHLTAPGIGRVETSGSAYRFLALS